VSEGPRELIVPVGLPGSGKSTWSRELVDSARPGKIARINGDSLRAMLHNGRYDGERTEAQTREVTQAAIRACFLAGARKVIVDATNLKLSVLRDWHALAAEVGVKLVLCPEFCDVPFELCLTRNAKRAYLKRVPTTRMYEMRETLRNETLPAIDMMRCGLLPWEPAVEKKD